MAGMDQSLGLHLSQTLSPQMQQSLNLLQAPSLELRALIARELAANPVLEDVEPVSDEIEEPIEELSPWEEQWHDYMAQTGVYERRDLEAEERRERMFDTLSSTRTLQQHLLEQLALADIPEDDREIADAILGNLDDSGLLAVGIP